MSDTLQLDELIDDPGTHRRLCALLRLLTSNVMGEQSAAAQEIARLSTVNGWRWENVIPTRSRVAAMLAVENEIAAARVQLQRTIDDGPRPYARDVTASRADRGRRHG